MPLKINVRQLEKAEQTLRGQLPAQEMDLMLDAEVIRAPGSLHYRLQAQHLEHAVLVQGSLRLDLECDCVRCLKRFTRRVDLPEWTCHLPLTGEDKVTTVDDSVDLTPLLREDILLSLPQHPLCKPGCRGMKSASAMGGKKPADQPSAAWAALDKLKIEKE
jgi:uncharacterized protein